MRIESDYLAELSNTDLMRVTIALATEVYELKDRLRSLEQLLTASGLNLDALEEAVEPAAFDAERRRRRDDFVARVFAGLRVPDSD